MPITVKDEAAHVEVTFTSVPGVKDLQDLRRSITDVARRRGGGVLVLAIIEQSGLGALQPDARQVFMDQWKELKPLMRGCALVVRGDGVQATLTRGFVRMLSTALGRAWTIHDTRELAVAHLATLRNTAPA